MVNIFLCAADDFNICDGLDIPSSPVFWSKVLKILAIQNNWLPVLHLVLGLTVPTNCPLQYVAADAPTSDIRISPLLTSSSDTALQIWGISLAIKLLQNGAPIDGIAADDKESVPIALTKSAIRAGIVLYIIRYFCKNVLLVVNMYM